MIVIAARGGATQGQTWRRGFDSIVEAFAFIDILAASGVEWDLNLLLTDKSSPLPPERRDRPVQWDLTSGG